MLQACEWVAANAHIWRRREMEESLFMLHPLQNDRQRGCLLL